MVLALAPYLWANSEALHQLPAHVGGRVLIEAQPNKDPAYRYSWPGIYFETAFKGDSLNLEFDDDQNIFRLLVDDAAAIIIKKPGKTTYPVKNLTLGTHKVRLEKLTETQWSTGRFNGFYSTGKPLPISNRTRQIEFIGDSFTVGYGNTSSSRECNNEELFQTTNTQLAFGPLTAKALNADYQINASSGFGIVRNYNGSSPDKSLLSLYPYTLNQNTHRYDKSASANSAKWQPQVIVIGLGTNDFSTPLNADERWKTREDLHNDYVAHYTDFVKSLHRKNPKAHFILMASDQTEGEIATQVERVIKNLNAEKNIKTGKIIFTGLNYAGCHWHPSTQDDAKLTQLLVDYLKAAPKVWR